MENHEEPTSRQTRDKRVVIKEVSSSGREARPGLAEILAMCEVGRVELLVCYSLDRLSRDSNELLGLVERLQRAEIGLETVAEGDIFACASLFLLKEIHTAFPESATTITRTSQGRKRRSGRKRPKYSASQKNLPLFEE